MAVMQPETELQEPYSDEGTEPVSWATGRELLDAAEVYWVSTVRPDGRPGVTPVIAIWLDEALHFCTGPMERKARNLEQNQHCVIVTTTGGNSMGSGFDVVVEGDARRVTDGAALQRLADAYAARAGTRQLAGGSGNAPACRYVIAGSMTQQPSRSSTVLPWSSLKECGTCSIPR